MIRGVRVCVTHSRNKSFFRGRGAEDQVVSRQMGESNSAADALKSILPHETELEICTAPFSSEGKGCTFKTKDGYGLFRCTAKNKEGCPIPLN